MEWKSVQINLQNIKAKSGNAVLVQMPHKSKFDGYSLWHPAKLIKDGSHSYALNLFYNDSFKFKLKRISKKTFKVLDEIEIDASQFEAIWGGANDNDSYLIVEEPVKVDKKIEIVDELKNE